jgi:hypothetical protein
MGAAPQLPAIPDLNTQLADYLRRLALWCQSNFSTTLQTNSAATALLLQSTTGNTVWRITVDDAGALHVNQLTPGASP